MAMASVVIEQAEPWRECNEHEGAITIRLAGVELVGRAVLASAAEWEALASAPGAVRRADVSLERTGVVDQLATAAPPSLLRQGGTIYELVGMVLNAGDDALIVEGPIDLRVDLSTPPGRPRPALRLGATVRIVGELLIELEDG